MWVRTRGLKTYLEECHFQEKAMPSAGPLPFLQSFFCTFNNTCHSSTKEFDFRYNGTNNSTLSTLISDMEYLLNNKTTQQRLKNVKNVTKDIDDLRYLISNITSGTKSLTGHVNASSLLRNITVLRKYIKEKKIKISENDLNTLLKSQLNVEKLSLANLLSMRANPKDLLCDTNFMSQLIILDEGTSLNNILEELCATPNISLGHLVELNPYVLLEELTEFVEYNLGRELSWEQWRQLNTLFRQLADDLTSMQGYQDIASNSAEVGKEYRNLTTLFAKHNISTVYSNYLLVQRFLCGLEIEDIMDLTVLGSEESDKFDSLRQQLNSMNKDMDSYVNDSDATALCNDMFRELENNTMTRFIWLQIKPFFRGKIPFAPDTPATRRIMQRVNMTFDPILDLKEMAEHWLNITLPKLRETFVSNEESLKYIQSFLETDIGQNLLTYSANNSIINNLLATNTSLRVNYVKYMTQKLLQENNTKLREDIFDTIQQMQMNLTQILECFDTNKIEGYATEDEASDRGMELLYNKKLWGVVVFNNIESNETDVLPSFLHYKIRMDSSRVDGTDQIEDRLPRPGPRRRPAIDLKYITYGFAYLQDMVEKSIIIEHTGRNATPGIFLQQFPYPCYIIDKFVMAISRTFPMFMTLSWVYSCSMIIKSIVYEKERRLKEIMRVMGLGNGVHWVGWFLDSLLPMIFTISLLTLILVSGKVLENSEPSVVFVFLFMYCVATICKSFLISVFFSRANLAAAAGGIVFFIMYLPYPFMVIWEEHISSNPKVLASLLSNVAFGFGCSYFAHYEEMGVGLHWHNLGESPLLGDTYNMKYVIFMLGLDALLYSILTWYIEAVFPGQYGVPKRWYFPLTRSYWCGSDGIVEPFENLEMGSSEQGTSGNFESEPKHLHLGVSLCNLGKVYGNKKVAVRNLNLNFYEDQITSFLGHNGAGKTTTISILTGLLRPSSGTAYIYGVDIRKDMDSIRQSLGTCPQHNVLFDELTVEEHLWFYARLKDRPVVNIEMEINIMIEDLGLPDKRQTLSRHLSGGMQRKLSIAAAFIGGSRTVILDEPTAGVDPYSRRSIWELLIKYKQGRTIILTTHFMDEADLLGDRIAIIANGNLRCCGSSMFLKNKFGSGYYLTLEHSLSKNKEPQVDESAVTQNGWVEGVNSPSDIDYRNSSGVATVTQFIKSFIPVACLHQHRGSELVYVLPSRENIEQLEHLLEELDSKMHQLGIHSYGITDTTLEEIFLRVADQDNPVPNGNLASDGDFSNGKIAGKNLREEINKQFKQRVLFRPSKKQAKMVEKHKISVVNSQSTKKEIVVRMKGCDLKYKNVPTSEGSDATLVGDSWRLHWRQFWTLHIKRFHHTRRNPKALFTELVVPAVFMCLSLGFTVILPQVGMPKSLSLEPWLYGPPNYVFFSNNNPQAYWASRYERMLNGPVGMGTRCVHDNLTRNEYCHLDSAESFRYSKNISASTALVECSCARGTLDCPNGAGGPTPPEFTVPSGDILMNTTGRNISDWLVKTSSQFYKRRYGGFTFGVHIPTQLTNISRVKSLLETLSPYSIKEMNAFQNWTMTTNSRSDSRDRFDNIKVWFNNKGWASSVAYMNAINNVVLRASLNENQKPEQYGFQVYSHPMNYTETQMKQELIQQSGVSLLHAISVIFALSFVPASFVVFLIEERVSNAKHLQFVSGVNRLVYWVSTFCWDFASYLLAALLCVFVFLAFDEQAYVSDQNIAGLVLLLLLYGWASIPLMYPASFVFDIPSSAFVTLACANVFVGIATTVATFVLEIFDDKELQYIASIIREVFLVFPHFCLGQGLMNMAAHHFAAQALTTYGVIIKTDIFEWDFLGKNLMCMFIAGIVFFFFNLVLEFQVFEGWMPFGRPEHNIEIEEEEDEDVAAERRRVRAGETQDDILLLDNITKVYKGKKPAVNRLCLGVKRGECFGLLGLNGAGKTSTFKMLTGDTKVSSGNASIAGYNVCTEMDHVRLHLGYCPQFDALDPLLTVREHLELYSRLRGVPGSQRHTVVDTGLKKLGLGHYEHALAGTLSGGNKRKLSTAIALIGDPPLVFMDEPTSGMDPKARRFLWSCISDVVASGRSVVLTSHSMEECEALCTRITIMVNGTFKCLGSSQHLKSKFGRGYTLIVRCKSDTCGSVSEHITSILPHAKLTDVHHTQLQFELAQGALTLALVFRMMQQAKQNGLIEDYSLSQTTLEEVFMRFAKEQTAEKDTTPHFFTGCIRCCVNCADNSA
uniref:ABC transporter domain-containing protein n=1 Tax=Timema poppense TaxID=170557 RepID=A0A7R9GZ03_TIMPO|nr:unnamed protein product [Timema poppensis]